MKTLFKLALVGAFLSAGIALGASSSDSSSASNSAPVPSAIARSNIDSKTAAAPLAGKNSFTIDQVRRRLANHGYADVRDLQLDHRGVWNGNAQRGGAEVQVSVDYQGNITSE